MNITTPLHLADVILQAMRR